MRQTAPETTLVRGDEAFFDPKRHRGDHGRAPVGHTQPGICSGGSDHADPHGDVAETPPSLKAEAKGDVSLGGDFLLIHETSPLALQSHSPLFETFSNAMK